MLTHYYIDAYNVLFKRFASAQNLLFFLLAMKSNTLSNKLVIVTAAVCALMLAFSHNVSAAPHAMPSTCTVPDGGTTALLLGAAIGALGLARRFLSR
jgi:VPDSG-CTERM motif